MAKPPVRDQVRVEGQGFDLQPTLSRLAASLIAALHQRAFFFGRRARGSRGGEVEALQQTYAWYKSGTRPYVSAATREAANRKRARSGKPGPGPLVNVLGLRTRLGPRSNQPDQRLTDLTAKALGVVRYTERSVTVGFRGDRAQRVAAHLERRNAFFAPTRDELAELQRIAQRELAGLVRGVAITGRVTVTVRL